jgi:hypothetical protein
LTAAAIVAGLLLVAYYAVLRWAYGSSGGDPAPDPDVVVDNGGAPPLDLEAMLATAEAFDAAMAAEPLGEVVVEEDVDGVVWVLVDGSPRAILSRKSHDALRDADAEGER